VKRLFTISVILLTMSMFSCANKQVVAPNKPVTEVAKEDILPPVTDKASPAIEVDKDIIGKNEDTKNEVTKNEDAVKEAQTSEPFKDIYFDYDKSGIKSESKDILKGISDFMIANLDVTLSVEGHCDERGTNEYNISLGDRRAKAVMDYLVSLGVTTDKISTFSYGKESPVCAEHEESCWSKNRRAHIVVTKNH